MARQRRRRIHSTTISKRPIPFRASLQAAACNNRTDHRPGLLVSRHRLKDLTKANVKSSFGSSKKFKIPTRLGATILVGDVRKTGNRAHARRQSPDAAASSPGSEVEEPVENDQSQMTKSYRFRSRTAQIAATLEWRARHK